MTELVGEWVNQNGSRLRIESVDAGGELRGTFQSAKGRAARDKSYPVLGMANGEVVSFAVNFTDDSANLHSISTFSGRLDGATLHTVWVLARQYEDAERTKPTQPWNAFLVNSDRFTKADRVLGRLGLGQEALSEGNGSCGAREALIKYFGIGRTPHRENEDVFSTTPTQGGSDTCSEGLATRTTSLEWASSRKSVLAFLGGG